jgi:hypothetical protein
MTAFVALPDPNDNVAGSVAVAGALWRVTICI